MVKRLSNRIATYLCDELNYSENKREILSYGLEVFLGDFFKIVAILILSGILDVLFYTVVGLISFVLFRIIIGGIHNSSFEKCFITSTIIMILIGFIGKYFAFLITDWIAFLVYFIALIITIIWVPAGTEKKTINNPVLRKKMKIQAIFLLSLWQLIIIISPDYCYQKYAFSSVLGVLIAFLLVTPPAYKIIKIEKIISKRG